MLDFPREYTPPYPIHKTPGPWLVVGVTVSACREYIASVDIHLDADDPNYVFATKERYPKAPQSLLDAANRPFTRAFRLRVARMTTYTKDIDDVWVNAEKAWAALRSGRFD